MHKVLSAVILIGMAIPVFAQDYVTKRLEQSPRHQEWVDVKNGERSVRCFVVYPEVKTRAMAVLVIHENKGLTDWVRGVADQLAEAGTIAIAPDFLSGAGPEGGNTGAFKTIDEATQAIYKLPPEQVMSDLNAVSDYAIGLPACDGRLSVAGFCWGGTQSFRYAGERPSLKAAFVFYGTGPDDQAALARIACPVYGFYGADDARVTATVPASAGLMKEAGKTYDPVIYEGGGHGFMRSGEDPQAAEGQRNARDTAWVRWLDMLKAIP